MTQELEQQRIEQLRDKYGGELSEEEVDFLHRLQQLFQNVLTARRGFTIVVEIVATKLNLLLRSKFDASLLKHLDMRVFEDALRSHPDALAKTDSPLTLHEEHFCKGVIAAIEYVIRNGIGFGLIVNFLCHDITEIVVNNSLDQAIARGFSPKTSGWADYDPNSWGVPDQSEE